MLDVVIVSRFIIFSFTYCDDFRCFTCPWRFLSESFQQMVAWESSAAKAHLRFVEIHAAYQEVRGVAGSAATLDFICLVRCLNHWPCYYGSILDLLGDNGFLFF